MHFHDRSKRLTFLKLQAVMVRASTDKSLVEEARAYVKTFMLPDPHQRAYGEMWLNLLDLPVAEIAARLLADSPEGDLLRDTAPVFGKGLSPREVARLIEENIQC
jgi:hypothetical protein